jgi:SAM-dependent methyltransferase
MRTAEDDPYLFPQHPSEFDRLDVQHYALRMTIGANYLAPVETPRRVLDSGSGTGQWAYELCDQFPQALVTGLDLQPTRPRRPPNFHLVRGNLLQGLPFADGQFDFVHQRLLVPAIPLQSWAALVAELVRVTRPGGWVELVEADWGIEPAGPASERLVELAGRLARSHGLDAGATIFRSLDRCLADAGLVDVQRQAMDIPLGDWGGRAGSLMASDYRAAASRLSEVWQARFGLTAEECQEVVRAAVEEWDVLRSRCSFAFAFGRKPG